MIVDPELARQFDKTPPHDIDAEKCVLASMMLDESGIICPAVIGIISRDAFFQADHQIIFDILVKLHKDGKPIDAIIVSDELRRRNLLEECGGIPYLGQIVGSVPSSAHGAHYAKIVREKHLLRGVISSSNEALRRAYGPASEENHAEKIARIFQNDLSAIACGGQGDRIHRLSEVAAQVLMDHDQKAKQRFPTGLIELDEIIGGIPKQRFTLVGGRPAMGKSLCCKQIVLNIARRGIPCGIISIEETSDKIAQNYLSNLSGVENRRVVYDTIDQQEVDALVKAMKPIGDLPIFISDQPVRLSDVESVITAMVMKYKCQLVVVDYLQLISLDAATENENREITRISKALKAIFKTLNIAGLVAAQLNRGNETSGIRKPTLRDLRGSGSLEQDGDLILLLHREDYYHRGEDNYTPDQQVEVIIAKNKDGPTGNVPLRFEGKTQRISDWRPADNVPDFR